MYDYLVSLTLLMVTLDSIWTGWKIRRIERKLGL